MKRLLVAIIMIAFIACNKYQSPQEAALTQQLVTSQDFLFKAESAHPLNGRVLQLTPGYDLRISKDTLVAYLPFFGRAYLPPVSPTEGGIQFTSTNFKYKITQVKNGWDVLIQPLDTREVQDLILNISTEGHASLSVTSTNRQQMNFQGYVSGRNPI